MFRKPPVPFKTWDEYRTERDAFYMSPEWREIRKRVIKKSDGRCVYCGKKPTPDNPINIDHRVPLCKNWNLRLCLGNLQVTCRRCNLEKSGCSHKKMLKKMRRRAGLEKKAIKKAKKTRKKTEQERKNNLFWSEYLK